MKTVLSKAKVMMLITSCVLSLCACTSKESVNQGEWAVVAVQTGDLTVANLSLFGDEKVIPLSSLVEELQILKLDDSDAAIVKNSPVVMSENYVLVCCDNDAKVPFKLFDRKSGKFISNIGGFGQGPNEYRAVFDMYLDEANNRVYILPWQTKKILVYDLTGANLEPVPLSFDMAKGKVNVDTKAGTAIVSIVPMGDVPAVVWKQDLKGNLIQSVAPGHLRLRPDFSNEVYQHVYGGNYDFYIWTFYPKVDSLYRYDVKNNKINPVFTLDYDGRTLTMHNYAELQNYFMGFFAELKRTGEISQVVNNQRFYIIDKKTLKGTFFSLENDFLGGLPIDWLLEKFNGDYFAQNYDPGDLLDALTNVLETNESLTDEVRAKITKLKDSIDPDDNNYILYARLKK